MGKLRTLTKPLRLAIALSLNLLDFFLWIALLGPFTRCKPSNAPRSVEVGNAVKGEGRPRRNVFVAESTLRQSPSEDISTMFDLMKQSAARFSSQPCFGIRDVVRDYQKDVKGKKLNCREFGETQWLTYKEMERRVLQFGQGLRHIGADPGAFIGIYEDTRAEWMIAAHGAFSQSITVVTVYANLGQDALCDAVNEGSLTHIVTNGSLVGNLLSLSSRCPSLKHIIFTDKYDKTGKEPKHINIMSFAEVEEKGRSNPTVPVPPKPDSTAVIMYTSGSTNKPKGVIILHKNMLAIIAGVGGRIPVKSKGEVYLGYLPLAHVLELAAENYAVSVGMAIGYGNPRTLMDATASPRGDLKEFRPTVMAGVPRVWDTIRKGIDSKIKDAPAAVQWLFRIAYAAKKNAVSTGSDTPLWNTLLFNKFTKEVGGRLRLGLSGGAPLSAESHEFMRVCFGLKLVQGYGLTETSGGSTMQAIDDPRPGVVGPPLDCCEVKLVDVPEMNYLHTNNPPQGEVWIRGHNITSGYYKMPKETREAYEASGWFKTGDIGQWMDDGSLAIIDRKKNLVKLAMGEYVALEKLESIYGGCEFVLPNGICTYADGSRTMVVALVLVDIKRLRTWAKTHNVSISGDKELAASKEAKQAVLASFQDVAKKAKLLKFEQVQRVSLILDEWTPENGLLTTSMKINRRNVQSAYKKEIEEMYAQ